MQDRYLFRGKRIDNGEWVYWNRFGECTEPVWTDDGMYSHIAEQYVDPATVGQCTGLKDKNGRLIFEGDVVKGRNEHEVSDVIYKDGVWTLAMFLGHTPALWEIEPMEVIDNIHDKREVGVDEDITSTI